ncbi:hypothetical protein ACETU7_33370 [Rhodococcus sp. 3Y1]
MIRRLDDWAIAIAEDAVVRARTDQLRLIADLDAEHDNLLAVLRWAVERGDAVTVANVFPSLRFCGPYEDRTRKSRTGRRRSSGRPRTTICAT